ncbi:hypothetical protein ILUMI_21658 [Ignelater luminosus]|uniref:Uncharacterized protein n=1 Tax=Ignelater luminosus TaxID=2038154 RepID=A0A8K0CC19_IGNLU|nr:hypothetical protein ILUMI_21658 [Ignelater luminosus]
MKMANVYYVCFLGLLTVVFISHENILLPAVRAELYPAPDFSRYTLIKPRLYHGREKREISTTKSDDDTYVHHLSINYDIDGKNHILDLQLNRDLIPTNYFKEYQKNGKHVVNRPNKSDVELCHYKGKIRGIPNSWAAISTCNEESLTGVVYDGQEMHYLQKASNNDDLHFLYKHSDLVNNNNKTCGYDDSYKHQIKKDHEFNRIHRYKRAAETTGNVKGPYNANRKSRYVELVLVVDNAGYIEMGESKSKVERRCKTIANILNGLYAPLNIFIALVGVVIWTEHDEANLSPTGDTTLANFLHYRRDKLIKEHPNDNAHLLTKVTFDYGVVGKALKGPICSYEYSGAVSTDRSSVVGLVATTVAHQLGHNFVPSHWSSCSLEYLALAFEHGMDHCLRNKPEALFDSPVCGNGFVESGEQCDCGLPEYCDNNCCNATICMLYSNATCATGECCDLQSCQPKTAGTMCRSADYECDLPEYCTGQSEYCPADIHKRDTEICDDGKAYCYKGSCRTHTDQCKLLWGDTGKSSNDRCYQLNIKGSRHGNCGYNKLNQTYFKCNDEDVLCGMLHCQHLNERLEYGLESVAILSHSFIEHNGSIIPCRTAVVDLGINEIDPGLVPNGAKCGESKMCVNQKCVSIDSLRAAGRTCPNNCNNNGVCNSLGHCHCKDGFAPPLCDYPGFGGSEDSGPTTDPEGITTTSKITVAESTNQSSPFDNSNLENILAEKLKLLPIIQEELNNLSAQITDIFQTLQSLQHQINETKANNTCMN